MSFEQNKINEGLAGDAYKIFSLAKMAKGSVSAAVAKKKMQDAAKKKEEENQEVEEENFKMNTKSRSLNKFDTAYEGTMSKLYEPLSEEEKEKGFLGKAWDTAKTVAGAAALVGGGYALGNPALRGKIGAALKGAVKGGKLGDMAGHTGDTAITAFNKGAAATARTPLPVSDPYHIPGLKGLDARMAGKPIPPTPAAAASDAITAAQKSGTAQTISTVNKSLKRAIPDPLTPLTDPNIRAAAGKVGDSISGAYDRVRDQLKAAKAAAATPATTTGAAATPAPATNLNPSAGSGSLSMGRTAFNTKPTTPAPANTTGAPAGGAATQQGSRVRGTTNVRTRPANASA